MSFRPRSRDQSHAKARKQPAEIHERRFISVAAVAYRANLIVAEIVPARDAAEKQRSGIKQTCALHVGDPASRIDAGRGDSRGRSAASVECNSARDESRKFEDSMQDWCRRALARYEQNSVSTKTGRKGRSIERRGTRSLILRCFTKCQSACSEKNWYAGVWKSWISYEYVNYGHECTKVKICKNESKMYVLIFFLFLSNGKFISLVLRVTREQWARRPPS